MESPQVLCDWIVGGPRWPGSRDHVASFHYRVLPGRQARQRRGVCNRDQGKLSRDYIYLSIYLYMYIYGKKFLAEGRNNDDSPKMYLEIKRAEQT